MRTSTIYDYISPILGVRRTTIKEMLLKRLHKTKDPQLKSKPLDFKSSLTAFDSFSPNQYQILAKDYYEISFGVLNDSLFDCGSGILWIALVEQGAQGTLLI